MEISKTIKKCLVCTCIYFTLIHAGYMAILQLINMDEGAAAVEAPRVLLFFLFSLLLSIANLIRSIKTLNSAIGYVIHYIICIFAFYSCFMLPDNNLQDSTLVTGLIIFTFGYVIVMALTAFFKARLKANRTPNTAYTKQFNIKK